MITYPQYEKLKVSFICPCVGIGGADIFMLSMLQQSQNMVCTGIAVGDKITIEQLNWARYLMPNVPIWQLDHDSYHLPGVNYNEDFATCVYNASEDSNIIVSWSMPKIHKHLWCIKKPIVELAQNCDGFAAKVCKGNTQAIDFRVAVSTKAIEAYAPEDRSSVTVIPNGIDPTRCTPRFDRTQLRRSLGVKDSDKLIVYAGRFVEEKYPRGLINALLKLDATWKGIFVGRGYLEEPLFKEAQSYLSSDRILFMEPHYHVGDIFNMADVFMLVSDFEGLPLTVLEAWLAGVPTVLSSIDPITDLMQKYETKLSTLVPPRSSGETLAKACKRAISSDKEVIQEVFNARNIVWTDYNIAKITLQWEGYLNDCLHKWHRKQMLPTAYAVPPMKPATEALDL